MYATQVLKFRCDFGAGMVWLMPLGARRGFGMMFAWLSTLGARLIACAIHSADANIPSARIRIKIGTSCNIGVKF